NPWLGEISTEEWARQGNCALWAVSSVGSTTLYENSGVGTTDADQVSSTGPASSSRARNFSVIVRAIGRRFISMFSADDTDAGNQGHIAALSVPVTASAPTNSNVVVVADPEEEEEDDYNKILERFGIDSKTIDDVLLSLRASLKTFIALKSDMIQGHLKATTIAATTDTATATTAATATPDMGMDVEVVDMPSPLSSSAMADSIVGDVDVVDVVEVASSVRVEDKGETFLRLVVLLSVLAFGAIASIQDL
ncbi:hypothetical protein BGZ65_012215, partial [Modicella reniformis]